MTIREAKAAIVILDNINPLSQLLLPEKEQKAVDSLRIAVQKKIKQYPNYFKVM